MPTTQDQAAELRGLQAAYPPPADEAGWLADREWLTGEERKPDWTYWNTNVAVLDKQIVGTGPDGLELLVQVSRTHHVHPNRVVVTWCGEYDRPCPAESDSRLARPAG